MSLKSPKQSKDEEVGATSWQDCLQRDYRKKWGRNQTMEGLTVGSQKGGQKNEGGRKSASSTGGEMENP